jgi:hypothetical protein
MGLLYRARRSGRVIVSACPPAALSPAPRITSSTVILSAAKNHWNRRKPSLPPPSCPPLSPSRLPNKPSDQPGSNHPRMQPRPALQGVRGTSHVPRRGVGRAAPHKETVMARGARNVAAHQTKGVGYLLLSVEATAPHSTSPSPSPLDKPPETHQRREKPYFSLSRHFSPARLPCAPFTLRLHEK